MRVNEETSAKEQRETVAGHKAITETDGDAYAPRKLTLAENAILTVKVFAGAGLVLAGLWGLTLWTSTN